MWYEKSCMVQCSCWIQIWYTSEQNSACVLFSLGCPRNLQGVSVADIIGTRIRFNCLRIRVMLLNLEMFAMIKFCLFAGDRCVPCSVGCPSSFRLGHVSCCRNLRLIASCSADRRFMFNQYFFRKHLACNDDPNTIRVHS
jgi:hypothetical protein